MPDLPISDFLIIFTVFAAPCMASLGMLMGDRWEEDRPSLDYLKSISIEPSHCDSCHAKISGLSLLPIIGWLATRGRCAKCGAAIPPVLLAAEITAVFFAIALTHQYGATAAVFLPAIAGLCAASRSDWRVREIHESASLLVLISAIMFAFATDSWADHLIAMAAIVAPLIIILPVYFYLGRIPVVPLGDIYLAAAISLTLTPDQLLTYIAALSISGLSISWLIRRAGNAHGDLLPMAPMMAVAWAATIIFPIRF